jgi:hypothetical protein
MARLVSPPAVVPDPNGNNDSGYAASNVEETALQATSNSSSPRRRPVAQQEDKQKVRAVPMKVITSDITAAPTVSLVVSAAHVKKVLLTELCQLQI